MPRPTRTPKQDETWQDANRDRNEGTQTNRDHCKAGRLSPWSSVHAQERDTGHGVQPDRHHNVVHVWLNEVQDALRGDTGADHEGQQSYEGDYHEEPPRPPRFEAIRCHCHIVEHNELNKDFIQRLPKTDHQIYKGDYREGQQEPPDDEENSSTR